MDAYHLPTEALPPLGLMFLLGTRALISLMLQQALGLADTPACHGWTPFLCKQMKLSMHSAKDDPISYINNNKRKTLAGSFSSVFHKKLRTTSQDGSEMMWTSWNSFKQRLMFLTFPLSFNWMSKGYKTAVSLSSSLIRFDALIWCLNISVVLISENTVSHTVLTDMKTFKWSPCQHGLLAQTWRRISIHLVLNLNPIFTILKAPFPTQPILWGNIRLSSHHLHQLVNNFVRLQFGASKV